jgi:aspartate aminotransferase
LGRKTPKGKTIATDLDLCMYFLEEAGVSTVPGSAFELPGHFRISYAASDANVEEGTKRIAEACRQLT